MNIYKTLKNLIFLTFLTICLFLPANANILPTSTKDLRTDAIGLYQLPQHIVIYKKPDAKSEVLYEANWDYKSFNASKGGADRIFSVFVQEKELAYAQVIDFTDDWLEIVYDKVAQKKGWIQAEDLRFMHWRNFYNVYGRKYGLKIFSDAPSSVKELHSSTLEDSQTVQTIDKPSRIKLTVVKGNWALITAIENNNGNTGYLRWRSEDGVIFAFPNIK